MNPIANIRARLGVTQAAMADALGVTQGNVSNYERGQTIPPDVARLLIEYANSLGTRITFNDIYLSDQEEAGSDIDPSIAEAEAARNGGMRTHGDDKDRNNISK